MILCAAGDAHGALDDLFEDVLAFEASLGVSFDWILHVGDFGIWPDSDGIDQATRCHDGAGDFVEWWSQRRGPPRKTVFIKGNHEDFAWLDAQPGPEVLPNLFYLPNGSKFNLGGVWLGGVGGCYGPSNYHRRTCDLRGYAKRHYTREDIDSLIAAGSVDVLLTHDAPAGVVFERHRRGPNWSSEAAGLDDLIRAVMPRVCFFGHHHTRLDAQFDDVSCIGLNKVGKPGNLVAAEVRESGPGFALLGEWPI